MKARRVPVVLLHRIDCGLAVLRTERNREQEKEGSSREGESKRETEEACRGGRVNNTRKKEVNGAE